MGSVQQSKDILGAYCFFWIFSMFFTVFALILRDPSVILAIRLFTGIAYGLYGGITLAVFDDFRQSDGFQDPRWTTFAIGQGFQGVFGIIMLFWALFTCLATDQISARAPEKKLSHAGFRSRLFFYLITVELIFVAGVVAGVALCYTHVVPWNYASCREKRLIGTDLEQIADTIPGTSEELCNHVVTTQILGIMTAIMAFTQAMAYVPIIAYPRIVRFIFYVIFGHAPPTNKAWLREKEVDADDLEQLLHEPKLRLAADSSKLQQLLADDKIVETIAYHLHFIDVENLSMTSQTIRQSILGNVKKPTMKRREMFCEVACVDGDKSECWACARMVCKACCQVRVNIPEPRTESHATSCFAVCTTCYLLRAPALPPPRAALSRNDDLAVQHNECWKKCSEQKTIQHDVVLCKLCNLLPTNTDVSEVRERRDAESLRQAHGGRLWCAECQKSLRKGRRRWFICETGQHECHWKGHQVC